MSLDLTLLPHPLAVCRLLAGTTLPAWAVSDGFTSVSWTGDETSIVCSEAAVPSNVQVARDRGGGSVKVRTPRHPAWRRTSGSLGNTFGPSAGIGAPADERYGAAN